MNQKQPNMETKRKSDDMGKLPLTFVTHSRSRNVHTEIK
jgi:hypothetical protein